MSKRFRDYDLGTGNRIDARPQNDPAVAAGMRNIHRDMRGNVIGGMTAEGQGIGTKSSKFRKVGLGGGGSVGNPSTPGLDRLAAMQRDTPAPSFAEQEKQARERSAASGAFGKSAQNKAQRRSLFRDMQYAGGGAITPSMQDEAGSLGVSPLRFRAVADKMKQAPAMVAAPQQPIPQTIARRPIMEKSAPILAKR